MSDQCRDCIYLGGRVKCDHCAGGEGWPCTGPGVNPNQHVHPDMKACDLFERRPQAVLVS